MKQLTKEQLEAISGDLKLDWMISEGKKIAQAKKNGMVIKKDANEKKESGR